MKHEDRKSYPEVYYSKDVERVFSSSPRLPMNPIYSLSASPKEPKEPIKPDANKYYITLVLFIFIVVFVVCMFCLDKGGWGVFGLIVLIPLTAKFKLECEFYWKDKKKYQQELARYKQYVIDYPRIVKNYEKHYSDFKKRQAEYYEKVKEMESPKFASRFKKEEMKRLLSSRTKPRFEDCSQDVSKKGVMEDRFAELLKDRGFNVLLNKRVPIDDTYYYPDIIIEYDNLYIDVEIDEPYSGDDGVPIHYIEASGLSVDGFRNCYLNEMGFEVIRFSEEQICTHTNECFNVIQSVINSIKNGKSDYDCPSGFSMAKWNWDQARKLAEKQYRHTYMTKWPQIDLL